ncbi:MULTISPECIES: 50S ribosomal protein L3 [Thermoactinomyces]|uniref:Large ribosomal subunit protein uL3 n=1 Tax=Thermoactinomyces daqus TaxID=1329516 RepID=A0A7W1X934_9BACL|nr:50S ribosomal protein L3 [Thermoactinomyces daqus]MBA4542357.1 50S ribosomal protein L3 [Thermoactinomyces daqus]MBH8598856.1 50S ribosomal protein L3 [Thermoactinomyces sp. CICC 10523]MBH8604841.1 50S ribosomal protein L3 [Thermoactinomyces sp. CICC 10522]MBH8607333.1 50S ribosomal protein L3 [Thermoactinomyces sp. CICC 10521]
MKGILGKKIGMTQIFNEDGVVVPVTVVEAGPCVVLQKKELQTDGYEAIQLGFEEKKEHRSNKPELGHAKKANAKAQKFIKEVRGVNLADYELGGVVKADIFAAGELVDVTGTSKGKGFAGAIKRHNQARGPMSHGSRYHRGPGSLGAIAPNRVFKGQTLPGRMGGERVTTQNLEIVRVDADKNLILIKGSVPGPKNSYVVIKSAVKSK